MKKKSKIKTRVAARLKKMLDTPAMSGAFSIDSRKLKRRIDTYASVEPKPNQPKRIAFAVVVGPQSGEPLSRTLDVDHIEDVAGAQKSNGKVRGALKSSKRHALGMHKTAKKNSHRRRQLHKTS